MSYSVPLVPYDHPRVGPFTALATLPYAVNENVASSNAAGGLYPAGNYIIGVLQEGVGAFRRSAYRYDIAANSWSLMVTTPSMVSNPVWTGGDFIYWLDTSGLVRYSISGNSTTALTSPGGLTQGMFLTWDGGDRLMTVTGSNFPASYSISGAAWVVGSSSLGALSPAAGAAVRAVHLGGGGHLVAQANQSLVRHVWLGAYMPSSMSGSMTNSSILPAILGNTHNPVLMEVGGHVLVEMGNRMYRVNPAPTMNSSGTVSMFTTAAAFVLPESVAMGGGACHNRGYVYFMPGNGSSRFWRAPVDLSA